MDIKRVLTLIESAEQQTPSLTESRNMAKEMVMQHYAKQEIKSPVKRPVSKLNEYFKVVDNEMLNVMKEQQDAKRVEVKQIVNRVLDRLDEGKKNQTPKPRNFVAKNAMATTSGAGAHKDKKRAEKQGDVKHKKDRIPMDVAESDDWGSMSHREFKRRELQHELGHEDTPEFKRMMRERDRGPWYIKIDGEIFKQKGEPKVFDWRKGANNYALAILKNKPELKGKIFLTKKLDYEIEGVAEGSDWGEPKEILEDVLETLEREVEWPLTEVMDPKEVRQLVSPIVRAVNDKLLDLDRTDSEIDIRESNQLDEKAVSKAQQRFMGMVHAAKKGEKPASKEVAKVAKGMSAKAAKDFAKTKHKGLPDKKTDEDRGASKEKETEFHTKLDKLVHKTFGKRKGENEGLEDPKDNPCWKGYKPVGTKKKNGKTVPNCVPKNESIEVGAVVKVYSNVLKKPVLGTIVELKEGKAYVNYSNTKIVMAHPVDKVELAEVAGLARFIPGVGLVAGGYDAYQRAKQGDYTGAALSAGAGLAGLVPGVGTAAATGLIGAQLGRDKARTGSFLPSYDEIGAAGKQGQAATAAPAAAPANSAYTIKKGDTLTKIAKANNTTIKDIMAANPQITDPNKIMAGAKLTLPGQGAASTAPAGAVDSTRTTTKTAAQTPPAEPPKQAAITKTQPVPDVSAGGASVTNRKLDVQAPVTTKQGNVTTTTSGSSSSATLKGITQDMIMNHPVYKAEMAKAAGKDPIQVRMAQKAAELKAKDAIGRDPSYLKNYKAPTPTPTGNSRIDNF